MTSNTSADLPLRMRACATKPRYIGETRDLFIEGAAEIERLTRERDEARAALSASTGALVATGSECDRLRMALLEVMPQHDFEDAKTPEWDGYAERDWLRRARALVSDDPDSAPETPANPDAADAMRYRWLKVEDRKRRPLATISWRQRDNGLPCKLADNDPLDALIDAAVTSPGASVEQIYNSAVKATAHPLVCQKCGADRSKAIGCNGSDPDCPMVGTAQNG